MKLYHVYTINPIGEKCIENTFDNGDDAELFLAQLDSTLDPSCDAGIDEEILDEKPYEAILVNAYDGEIVTIKANCASEEEAWNALTADVCSDWSYVPLVSCGTFTESDADWFLKRLWGK